MLTEVMLMSDEKLTWANAPDVLSVPQAAQLMAVHTNTIYNWISAGDLPAHRTSEKGHWRIRRRDLFRLWAGQDPTAALEIEVDRLKLALREILLTTDIVTAHRVAADALGEGE